MGWYGVAEEQFNFEFESHVANLSDLCKDVDRSHGCFLGPWRSVVTSKRDSGTVVIGCPYTKRCRNYITRFEGDSVDDDDGRL